MAQPRNSTLDCDQAVTFASQLGWMALAVRDRRVECFTFGHGSARQARRALGETRSGGAPRQPAAAADAWLADLIARLVGYAAGQPEPFGDVILATEGATPFQRRVVRACRRVAWGDTVSYAELARLARSPGAARAVGNVMAKNPFPIIVPCHRVVGCGGSLGGYSAPSGLQMKRRLLRMEGSLSENRT